LSIEPGVDYVGRPAGWGREQDDRYNGERYHQPSDEYARDFRYDGMVQQVRVAMRVILMVADLPKLPDWLPTAEFRRH
jgi:hypothetical protein